MRHNFHGTRVKPKGKYVILNSVRNWSQIKYFPYNFILAHIFSTNFCCNKAVVKQSDDYAIKNINRRGLCPALWADRRNITLTTYTIRCNETIATSNSTPTPSSCKIGTNCKKIFLEGKSNQIFLLIFFTDKLINWSQIYWA